MPVKSRPRAVSRVSVQVVLLDSMSTSPDCSAVKRCCADTGVYFTCSESPKMAAATARQTSTLMPVHLPWLSASMKPARPPVATPQINTPRALTASRSLPARAWPDGKTVARPSAIARSSLCIADPPPSFILAPLLRHPCSTTVEACARDYLLAEQSLMQDHCRLMLFRTAGACPERSRRIPPAHDSWSEPEARGPKEHERSAIGASAQLPLFRGSSFESMYSRPSGPIAVTCVTYSPDFAQWKCGVSPGRTTRQPGG